MLNILSWFSEAYKQQEVVQVRHLNDAQGRLRFWSASSVHATAGRWVVELYIREIVSFFISRALAGHSDRL